MIGIGIIGGGYMGQNHARLLATEVQNARLVAVADANIASAEALAARHGGAKAASSAESLIADPAVQAIIVASPDHTHADFALAAVEAQKPVLVEKPLAPNAATCAKVVEAEQRLGARLVQVAYMRRYDPGYRAMKSSLDSGRIGEALFLHCIHRNAVAPHFMTSAAVLTNAVVHEIDVGRFLLGGEFTSVTVATPRAPRHAPDRLAQMVVLTSDTGAVMDVEAFLDAQYGYDVRAELVGEEGTLSLQPNPPVSLRVAGCDGYDVAPIWNERFEAAYIGLLRDWIAHAAEGRAGGSSAWDGYAATLTADACVAAWESGQKVSIAIPKRPALYGI